MSKLKKLGDFFQGKYVAEDDTWKITNYVVELDRLAGDPLDILANGTTIAKGEVVMVGERFGIRFTEVSDPEERVQNL